MRRLVTVPVDICFSYRPLGFRIMAESNYAGSIKLPTDQMFKNLKNAKRFAIDIGGSLAKLAYYSSVPHNRATVLESSKPNGADTVYSIGEAVEMRDQLHFVKFETKYIEMCLDFIQCNLMGSRESMIGKIIKVTGGGAHKYKDLLSSKLGVQIDKEDEIDCLLTGCNFLLKNIPDEAFYYQRHAQPEYQFEPVDTDNMFPYLLVNIGSGTSILKVDSETKYERVGGSSIGGGTFWGLGSRMTGARGFDELLDLAENGDHRNVDMLVRDIYGGPCPALGLPADIIASSFGKAARSSRDSTENSFCDADAAKSLLVTISNDIGHLASLYARLHGLKKIYFGGYFIRGHPVTMHTISFATSYWTKGQIHALFLRHEGYLGAIGAFLKGADEEDSEKYWWCENYAGSTALSSPKPTSVMEGVFSQGRCHRQSSAMFDVLELDRFTKPLVICPLVREPAAYFPDTHDLTKDERARVYWLQCFEEAVEKFAERAVSSQPSRADAEQRAKRFKDKYIQRLHELRHSPHAYGSLTVRSLLDTREHCLQEFHFVDPYSQQKQQESDTALKLLPARLAAIDAMEFAERQVAVVEGMLAGNVFDWGAKEVANLMESQEFSFQQARDKLQARPWQVDDLDIWVKRLQTGPPHNCAVIFVDNSGIDIILGVFPFARELLHRGTKVILCANSRPALNDVTYNELSILAKRVAALSADVQESLSRGDLLIMESGQGSPCLDLRYIDFDLSERMKDYQVDLIVLEGMGRAIHTNYKANFLCDALKVAVLKNSWLAESFGGPMYSVIFKYEPKFQL